MTICIAAICRYVYGKKPNGEDDIGYTVITASDRMYTDEGLGIQYETMQGKFSNVAKRVTVLAADNITVHSQILIHLTDALKNNEDVSVREVAELYSSQINKYREANAAKEYLSPFGLTPDTYLSASKNMDTTLVMAIADKMLNYEVNAEALVVGCDKDGRANIYSVDNGGIVTCHNDIGFAAIGIGHPHANSCFMSHAYWNGWPYYDAILVTYSAKKLAEVAPGVGKNTDMEFISRDGVFSLYPGTMIALEKLYPEHLLRVQNSEIRARNEIIELEQAYYKEHPSASPAAPKATPQPTSPETSSRDHT
jgi:20S proteasome alpha/beta subunit